MLKPWCPGGLCRAASESLLAAIFPKRRTSNHFIPTGTPHFREPICKKLWELVPHQYISVQGGPKPLYPFALRVDLNPFAVLFFKKDLKSNFRLSGNFVPVGHFFSCQPLSPPPITTHSLVLRQKRPSVRQKSSVRQKRPSITTTNVIHLSYLLTCLVLVLVTLRRVGWCILGFGASPACRNLWILFHVEVEVGPMWRRRQHYCSATRL